ncbi:hypothetical protein [Shimazuella kribbensis]|uniref:hypothetical protein n=1 Tax=Shimazuella kribbensis TaxID=139808 RepID=UPI0003FBF4DB|nr:hypothetical protein [Shimazuella kribbensis]
MNLLSNVIHFFVAHRIILLFVLIIGSLIIGSILPNKDSELGMSSILVPTIIILLSVVNVIWGTDFNNAFLNAYGITGNGVITKSELTISDDTRYYVLMRTQKNETIQTTFTDMNFNIHPKPEDGYLYPYKGEKFTIKYIPGAEDNFIILANDHSPYSKRLACSGYQEKIDNAKTEHDFESSNATFTKNYADALRTYITNQCPASDSYQEDLNKLLKK